MSDQTPQSNTQQPIVIALVVVALLLAALVGVLIFNQNKAAKAPTAADSTQQATPQTPATPAATTPFDAKTATKVPAGQTPEQMLKTYNEDVLAEKYEEAYKLLPIDKQKSYGDAKAYGSQLKGYGITSYKMGKATTEGDSMTIVTEQVTPQMPISYTWKFKQVGSDWFVESRTMGGTL